MPTVELDLIDIDLLRAVQDDARLTNIELAQRVALSNSPCWRRLRRLESAGVIKGYQAILDRESLGLGVTAFVSILIDSHKETDATAFEAALLELPEVVACHSVSGQFDFLLQVVSRDLQTYAAFAMNTLRTLPGIKEMHSNFSLKEIKASVKIPLPQRDPAPREGKRERARANARKQLRIKPARS